MPGRRLGRLTPFEGVVLAVAVGAVAVGAAACTTITDPSPTGTPAVATASPGPTAVPTDVGVTPRPTAPSQTDTEWGRIWDALPATFPSFPGASPTETGEGPASAILDAGTVEPAEVAGFYQDALESAGFTVSGSGPFEDGSFQLEATAAAGCATRITIAPLGGATLITILYGALCPFS
ncbi:MAG: hypothetical protein AB1736_14135 [Chloroflexota bacterium]